MTPLIARARGKSRDRHLRTSRNSRNDLSTLAHATVQKIVSTMTGEALRRHAMKWLSSNLTDALWSQYEIEVWRESTTLITARKSQRHKVVELAIAVILTRKDDLDYLDARKPFAVRRGNPFLG